jgi:hypothetical protein
MDLRRLQKNPLTNQPLKVRMIILTKVMRNRKRRLQKNPLTKKLQPTNQRLKLTRRKIRRKILN